MLKTPDTGRDALFSRPMLEINDFVFDQKVVDVFPDMIKRSVPGYSTILHMTGQLAAKYAKSGSHCYDLGCSLGASIMAMRHAINSAETTLIGVDNSEAMLARCQLLIDADAAETPVELLCKNIEEVIFKSHCVCVLNFTLQFVPIEKRTQVLQRIFDAMTEGGILILSEKLCFEDTQHDTLMRELHHYFKKVNGYSEMEIAQKREAIDTILVPETPEQHVDRLHNIGFERINIWFQCFNFSSLIAFKPKT